MPARAKCTTKDSTSERVWTMLTRAVAIVVSVVFLFLATSLLASVAGYAIYGWIGALTGLGLAWAVVGLGTAIVARSSAAPENEEDPAEPAAQVAAGIPQVAYVQPVVPMSTHTRPEPDACEESDSASVASRATLPLAALALGAAAVIGPVRALRMGLHLYSLWTGVSRAMTQSQEPQNRR